MIKLINVVFIIDKHNKNMVNSYELSKEISELALREKLLTMSYQHSIICARGQIQTANWVGR